MKFEHLLEKKCKELETLGDSLVYKEKEVLIQYKEKLEVQKMDKDPARLEKRALLEETSSEEDDDDEEMAFSRGKNKQSKHNFRGKYIMLLLVWFCYHIWYR